MALNLDGRLHLTSTRGTLQGAIKMEDVTSWTCISCMSHSDRAPDACQLKSETSADSGGCGVFEVLLLLTVTIPSLTVTTSNLTADTGKIEKLQPRR